MTLCSICSSPTAPFGTALVLGKYNVQYLQCQECGFVQTEAPYWLGEAYANAITGTDIGLVQRSIQLSRTTSAVIGCFFDSQARFLDYGGGYGLLVRIMRDRGFDFYWCDRYCSNLFARGFEAEPQGCGEFEIVTAFEVFEHIPSPLETMDMLLRSTKALLFTTNLLPANNPRPGTWWYYGPGHGQHVSFYTERCLRAAAARLGAQLYTDGWCIHLLSRRPVSQFLFSLASKPRAAALLARLVRRRSLLWDDFRRIGGTEPV